MHTDPLLRMAIAAVSAREKRDIAFDKFPIATYVTDAVGVVRHYNNACVAFAGRVPRVGTDKWCVSWELYTCSGERLSHDQCPMAVSIREKRRIEGARAIAMRPDRTSVEFEACPIPLFDESGAFVGAVNSLRDTSNRAGAAALWAEAARCRRLARSILDGRSVDTLKTRARRCEERAMAQETGHTLASKPMAAINNVLLRDVEATTLGEHALVFLSPGAVLLSADEPMEHIYFIESGLASAVSRYGEREVDVGMIGSEGMVGYERLLGAERAFYTTIMRIAGSAVRVPADTAIRLNKTDALFDEKKLSFVNGFCKQLAENCAANALLSVESRLARWLLNVSKRVGSDLRITHDEIASALGARRAGVTIAIHALEGNKAIRSTRARLLILDCEKLAKLAE